jgi:hypothetical protein
VIGVRARAWCLVPVAALALPAIAIIALGPSIGSWGYDQDQSHLPTVRQFSAQWPVPDLSDYRSTTGPMWHLLLSLLHLAGVPDAALRVAGVAAGGALVAVMWAVARRSASPAVAAALALPLACSPFVLGGSAWVTTDVPAALCMALALAALTATAGARPSAGLWAALATGIRQPLGWLAVPTLWVAWRDRSWRIAVAAILPVAVLGALVWMWGGLTPPAFRELHDRGANPAAVTLMLALAGTWGLPFVLAGRSRVPWAPLAGAAAAALAVALSFPSSHLREAGRWGGPIWQLVALAPSPAERSVVLVPLAALGGACLMALAVRAYRQGQGAAAGVLLVSLAMATIANAANSQAWQRYADPMLLLVVPWLAVLGWQASAPRRYLALAAVAVAAVQVGLAAVTIWAPLADALVTRAPAQ